MYPLQKLHRRYKEYTGRAFRRALTRTTTNFKDRQVLRRQHLPVPLCTFRGTHVPNHANVRVVDLHSLPRMFGPLHILLMHHDFLKDRQVLRRQHLPVPLCTFRGTHVPNHANVRVVDLHSLPRMFGPLHILLMHHDFLNEQPQQFRRQFLDVGVAPGF